MLIVWIESLSQQAFLDQSFGIQPAEYPQVIVLSARKKQYDDALNLHRLPSSLIAHRCVRVLG
jgi:hypothetical protein